MTPFSGVVDVASEKARDGRGGEEEDGFAAVVAAGETGFAGVAGDVRFDGDAVAGLEVLDGGVDGEDLEDGELVRRSGALSVGGGGISVPRRRIRGRGCVCLRRSWGRYSPRARSGRRSCR